MLNVTVLLPYDEAKMLFNTIATFVPPEDANPVLKEAMRKLHQAILDANPLERKSA